MLVRHTHTPPITPQTRLCGCQLHAVLLMLPDGWHACCVILRESSTLSNVIAETAIHYTLIDLWPGLAS